MRSKINPDAPTGDGSREIANPEAPRPIIDATDPRYGEPGSRSRARDPESFMDHSDPVYREPPDLAA